MKTVEYAIGYLHNAPTDDEALPICVLVNDPRVANPYILPVVDVDEIEAFDPESSGEFLVTYMEGMNAELREFSYEKFDMEHYIRPYVNSIRFEHPNKMELAEDEPIEDVLGLA